MTNFSKIISADPNELTINSETLHRLNTDPSNKINRAVLQIDAVSLAPSTYYDQNGKIKNAVIFKKINGDEVLKAISYMYAFLLVPTDAELQPVFLCGLLST